MKREVDRYASKNTWALFVGFAAFLIIMAGLIAMPKPYRSSARMLLVFTPPVPTGNALSETFDNELNVIQSDAVLEQVATALQLNVQWAKRSATAQSLSTAETIAALRRHLKCRPIPRTSGFEISFQSDDPKEAASVANEVAKAYKALVAARTGTVASVSIVDPAPVPTRPVRSFNPIAVLVVGVALGAAAAGFTLLFWPRSLLRQEKQETA